MYMYCKQTTIHDVTLTSELTCRSVKFVLQQEFEDKSNFIASNPFFKNWIPKYKKQLAMALETASFPYDAVLTKQGEPLSAIYFILRYQPACSSLNKEVT